MATIRTESIETTVGRLDERVQGMSSDVRELKETVRSFQRYVLGGLVTILLFLLAPYFSAPKPAAAAAPVVEKRIGEYVEMRPSPGARK